MKFQRNTIEPDSNTNYNRFLDRQISESTSNRSILPIIRDKLYTLNTIVKVAKNRFS